MTRTKVCILDYGSGNVGSVSNILRLINPATVISNSPEDIKSATHLILPGVGAFGASMVKVKKTLPLDLLYDEVVIHKKPFLGICVGMQVLADKGLEFGAHDGLGWIPGVVRIIASESQPLPHVGWNEVKSVKPSHLFDRFQGNPDFYFVHSYCFAPKNTSDVVATCSYGENFAAVVQRNNIYGVQFHPEKSQQAGRILLENFLGI